MIDSVFDKAAVYEDETGAVIYRASSLGRCIGALVRARLGVTGSAPPDDMQQKFDEGHEWEQRVILAGLGVDWTQLSARQLKQYGTVVEDVAGPQVETEIRWEAASGVKVIRCHPDAIAVSGARYVDDEHGNAERRVVEAKFFGTDLFYETVRAVSQAEKKHGSERQALGLGYPYAMQLSVEMLSTGLPALYVIGLKERAEDGTLGLGEVWTMEVSDPPYTLAEVKARVLEVEGWVTRGEMPKCPLPLDYPCAYWDTHDEREERPEITDAAMQVLMAQWQVLLEEAEALNTQGDYIKAEIDARMSELGVTSGPCGGYEVAVITPERGNVSWAKAYKALAKETKQTVDEDAYRGEPGKRHVRISKIKGYDDE